MRLRLGVLCVLAVVLAGSCASAERAALEPDDYRDRVHGAWVAMIVANHSGLPIEGIWIDQPGPGESIELVLLDEWSTDDDTHVEWLDLHIFEEHGNNPSYPQIRDEWVDHLNGDIWVATARARQLMDDGLIPPETSDPGVNPDAAWSMDAQLETELFGLVAPGDPQAARERAEFFALVTNRGPAVEASAFYAHMIAEAFFVDDPVELIRLARAGESSDSIIAPIADDVVEWHVANPDWRSTRARIGDKYDTDPAFWASRVNFAVTLMALLYGEGDLRRTLDIAGLAGWDADNNMTTAAGVVGVTIGFDALPAPFDTASDRYFNEDLSGDLPQYDSVANIAARTAALGEQLRANN